MLKSTKLRSARKVVSGPTWDGGELFLFVSSWERKSVLNAVSYINKNTRNGCAHYVSEELEVIARYL